MNIHHNNVIRIWLIPLTAFLLSLGITSCSGDDDGEDAPPPQPVSYTTLVYMMADNSMDSEVDFALGELKKGARHSAGTVVVYLDRKDAAPRLFKITQYGEEVLLRDYPERNSADAGVLAGVLKEVEDSVPAKQYGLVLWSHAMGWLPYSYDSYSARSSTSRTTSPYPNVRYIGMDNEPGADATFPTIEVDKLAKTLADSFPKRSLSYIWFDACLMGSVEVAYQLRNVCDYVVASPTDVLADAAYNASGIPYSRVLPYMFGGEADLQKAGEIYMEYYRGLKVKWRNSATLTVVKSSEMQKMYDEARKLLDSRLPVAGGMDVSGIQPYYQSATADVPNPPEPPYFFDLKDFMDKISGGNDAAFVDRLHKAIVYTGSTEKFIELPIDPDRYSGLSVYIPLYKWRDHTEYRYYFDNIEWSGVYGK